MADKTASVIWLDFNGVTRQTVLKSLTGAGAIWAAAQAASAAQVEKSWESVTGTSVGTATNTLYQSVKQSARLIYQTASGSNLYVTIPAPLRSIFLADGVTVDPSNALVLAVNAAAIGSLSDGGGSTAAVYIGGLLNPSRNDLPPIG